MAEAITVHCASCNTAFPVDPGKVPAGGVSARCSACGSVFRVEAPTTGPEDDTGGARDRPDRPGVAEEEGGTPAPTDVPEQTFGGGASPDETSGEGGPALGGERAADAADTTPSPFGGGGDRSAVEEPGATDRAGAAFGQRSPEEKAQRLARVLVSDMITYNPELYENALDGGTLEEDFEEEIEKSWEEYVEQVGEDLATSTPYWRNALNEILAKGEEIF